MLLGVKDVVPMARVRELFGDEAAEYAYAGQKMERRGDVYGQYGICGTNIEYLTKTRFLEAVGHANAKKYYVAHKAI